MALVKEMYYAIYYSRYDVESSIIVYIDFRNMLEMYVHCQSYF